MASGLRSTFFLVFLIYDLICYFSFVLLRLCCKWNVVVFISGTWHWLLTESWQCSKCKSPSTECNFHYPPLITPKCFCCGHLIKKTYPISQSRHQTYIPRFPFTHKIRVHLLNYHQMQCHEQKQRKKWIRRWNWGYTYSCLHHKRSQQWCHKCRLLWPITPCYRIIVSVFAELNAYLFNSQESKYRYWFCTITCIMFIGTRV